MEPVSSSASVSAENRGFPLQLRSEPTEIREKTEPTWRLSRLRYNCLLLHIPNYIFLLV